MLNTTCGTMLAKTGSSLQSDWSPGLGSAPARIKALPLAAAAVVWLAAAAFAGDGPRAPSSAVWPAVESTILPAAPLPPPSQPRKFVSPPAARSTRARGTPGGGRRANRVKRIIWATDGSESSDKALRYARSVAVAQSAELIAVHADEFAVGRGGGYSVNFDEERVKSRVL